MSGFMRHYQEKIDNEKIADKDKIISQLFELCSETIETLYEFKCENADGYNIELTALYEENKQL